MTSADTAFSYDEPIGECLAIAADTSPSYWQPVPANGYTEVIFSSSKLRSVNRFSMGTQSLPPGGTVRLHAHNAGEEVLYVLSGEGRATLNGQTSPMLPGTAIYLGHNVTHTFTAIGNTDLKLVWFFMPGGLEDFFRQIGRQRTVGEAAPTPFARPEDVKQIEAATVFSTKV